MDVMGIVNDYLAKIPEWLHQIIENMKQKSNWDPAKVMIAMRILGATSPSDLTISNNELSAHRDFYFTFAECNLRGRDATALSEYISSICEEINTFSPHIKFTLLATLNSDVQNGILVRIGWRF